MGGDPPPVVDWTKDGVDLGNNNNTVIIDHVSFDDAGQYGCTARNTVRDVSATIWIHVTGKSNSSSLECSSRQISVITEFMGKVGYVAILLQRIIN